MGKKTKKKLTLKLVQVEKRAAKFNLRMVSGVTQEVTLTSRIEIFQGWCDPDDYFCITHPKVLIEHYVKQGIIIGGTRYDKVEQYELIEEKISYLPYIKLLTGGDITLHKLADMDMVYIKEE